jgi:transcriptional regulator with XRE-family HTH domain
MAGFSEWIRTEIKQRGWSQATLAEQAGLSRSSISKMLTSGRRKPGMKFFAGISTAFAMPLTDVVVIWEKGAQRDGGETEG